MCVCVCLCERARARAGALFSLSILCMHTMPILDMSACVYVRVLLHVFVSVCIYVHVCGGGGTHVSVSELVCLSVCLCA